MTINLTVSCYMYFFKDSIMSERKYYYCCHTYFDEVSGD